MATRKPALAVRLTENADAMMRDIWRWNLKEYGEAHADAYSDFLYREMDRLGAAPERGTLLQDFPGLYRYLIRKRSRGHGHIAVYRVLEDRVEILFIYHTAQDWQRRLQEDRG